MNLTKQRRYDTEFGPFVITTYKGKARRRNYQTGKVEWAETQSTSGRFEEYPDAVDFFIQRDGSERYVSSSQGDSYRSWIESLGASSYEDALQLTDPAVVDCFRDYYGDSSIN